jgi:hypothetical protein
MKSSKPRPLTGVSYGPVRGLPKVASARTTSAVP